MEQFSINDCKLIWDKRQKTTKTAREKIKRDLKENATTIGKAIAFLIQAAKNGSTPIIKFLLGDNSEYELEMFAQGWPEDFGEVDFEVYIHSGRAGPAVAYVCSEKYRFVPSSVEDNQFLEEDKIN